MVSPRSRELFSDTSRPFKKRLRHATTCPILKKAMCMVHKTLCTIEEDDVLVMGTSCIDFSMAGSRQGPGMAVNFKL